MIIPRSQSCSITTTRHLISLSFKTVSKYIFSRWSHLDKTLNVKLISVEYSKLWNFPGKNYENLFEIVQNFLFDSAYVTFLQFSIYGKNSDPTFYSLYMRACQHDEKLKLHELMKTSDFRNLLLVHLSSLLCDLFTIFLMLDSLPMLSLIRLRKNCAILKIS